jgi:TIR domain
MQQTYEYDVFLSHSSHDKDIVRALAERMQQSGLRVWFDEWAVKIGDPILASIEEGLEKSAFVIFCMSAHAFGSDWVQLERQTFRFPDPMNRSRRLIPLRLDKTPLPKSWAQFKHLDWQPDNDQTYHALLEACGHVPKAPPAPEKTEKDHLANLLAWCDRAELVAALGDYLDNPAASAVGLLCMTAHIENRYELIMDRVSAELGKRVFAKTSKALHVRSKCRFDTLANFDKDLCEQLGIASGAALAAKLAKERLDVHLLCLYVDCTSLPDQKIRLLLRTAASWCDQVNLVLGGTHRLVLVLGLRYSDEQDAPQAGLFGRWFGRTSTPTLARIKTAWEAEARSKKVLSPLMLADLLVLGGYDVEDFLKWKDLPMVKAALGLTADDDLADDGFIAEHFAGGTKSFRELMDFVRKSHLQHGQRTQR